MFDFNTLFQQIANGIALGSVYALIAVGFTMVYGVLFFVNLPHGDVMMVGTYVVLALVMAGVPFGVAVLGGLAFTALLGVSVELFAYRRMRRARRLAPLLSAIGVSYLLSNLIMIIAGPRPRPFPSLLRGQLSVAGVTVPISILVTVAVMVTLAIALELFLGRTRLGIAIRATSQNLTATSLMGVNLNTVISVTFAISGGLAVIGGTMLGWRYGSVSPNIGFAFMLKAFAACVLGGIANFKGAIVGGILLGLAEVMASGYLISSYRDAIAFTILIAVLLIRPSGILGGRTDVIV